jgi:hypothetical protein
MLLGRAAPGPFPPQQQAVVKALACDRPHSQGQPLSRLSVNDVLRRARQEGIETSASTLRRCLAQDALRPWFHRTWLFPKDPLLLEKATPILELYHGRWQGEPLSNRDAVLSADEMTGLQALSRIHPSVPARPGEPALTEFEYKRHGTLVYTAFLNIRTGRVYGETSATNGIAPFEAALARCLQQPDLKECQRVFLIVDNGSSHHPNTSPARIRAQFPQVEVLHLPIHSSWLNQIEIYFSIVHRKALSPAEFPTVAALAERLQRFECLYNETAKPFRWNYSRADLEQYLQRLAQHEELYAAAASQTTAAQPLTLH